ncbi:hypothetical protein ACROYT_G015635 [Oculina patagonica]
MMLYKETKRVPSISQNQHNIGKLVEAIRSSRVSFSVWEKCNADGTASGLYEWTSVMPTKLEAFVGFMNNGSESEFFKRFTLHMTLPQLNALLTELESTVTFLDQIPRAVAVVGRNKTAEGNNTWGSSEGPKTMVYGG